MTSSLPVSPRVRLAQNGAGALSDVELLTVLLKTGKAGRPATQMAASMLESAGGLAELMSSVSGPPEIAVVIELAKRAVAQQLRQREVFGSPDAVKNYLQLHLARRPCEEFAVLFLDAQNRRMEMQVMFHGTLTQTSVYPREIVGAALDIGAAAVVLAHNHPSGTVHPSRADEALTQTLKAALALVDVRVLDHIIVGPGQALSMAEKGLV